MPWWQGSGLDVLPGEAYGVVGEPHSFSLSVVKILSCSFLMSYLVLACPTVRQISELALRSRIVDKDNYDGLSLHHQWLLKASRCQNGPTCARREFYETFRKEPTPRLIVVHAQDLAWPQD